MRLDEMLSRFGSPSEASAVCGLGRTAGYHWYASGRKRVIPPIEVLVCWVDHFGLSNEVLGLLVRDCCLIRSLQPRRKKGRKRKKPVDVVSPSWSDKEVYLESLEKAEKSAIEDGVLSRMQNLIERHIK